MKLDLQKPIMDWKDEPMPKQGGGALTVFDLIIPALYTSLTQNQTKEQKADIVELANKIRDAKQAGAVEMTVDELKLVQDSIEPNLVPLASKQFCDILNGAKTENGTAKPKAAKAKKDANKTNSK